MNRLLIIFWLSLILGLLASCQSSDTERHLSVAPVSNITYQAGNGSLLFRWENPKIENLSYVEVSYTDKAGRVRRNLTPKGESEQLIQGIADSDPYEFRFLTYNTLGAVSEPVVFMAQADEPNVSLFHGRVKMSTAFGGIRVSWENDFDENFYIELSYTDLNGNKYNEEIIAAAKTRSSQFVRISSNIQGTQSIDVLAQISDVNGNLSDEKVLKYYKKETGRLDRTRWSVAHYSSQNANAPAVNTIDGNVSTVWHSQWQGAKPTYPHHITYDLGAKKVIEKISLQHSQGAFMAKGIEMYGNNKSATAEEDQWYMFGSFEMAMGNNGEQSFDIPSPVEFRYVKVKFTTPGGGDQSCASLAEFWIFGQDLDEE